jgi:hypothetical protein
MQSGFTDPTNMGTPRAYTTKVGIFKVGMGGFSLKFQLTGCVARCLAQKWPFSAILHRFF